MTASFIRHRLLPRERLIYRDLAAARRCQGADR